MDAIDRSFHLLPVELLTVVFLACVPYPTRKNPGPVLSRNHPAVVLSHVCHDWRQIALGTPLLWSTMHIETSRPINFAELSPEELLRKCEVVKETIAVWVQRSAECPLTLVLDICGGHQFLISDLHIKILNDLVRSSKRWRDVQIKLGSSLIALRSLNLATQNLSADDFSMLASLSIVVKPCDATPSVTYFSHFLMRNPLLAGPMLREVSLGGTLGMYLGSLPHPFQRWAPLTELTVNPYQVVNAHTHFNTNHALKLLQSLPQLIKVSFKFASTSRQLNNFNPILQTPITLPHLQSLALRGVPMGPGFARSLILPSLNAMYLVFDTYEHNANVEELTPPAYNYGEGILELLRQFGPQLTALGLNPEPLTLESFPSCLHHLDGQRLKTLSLIVNYFLTPRRGYVPEESMGYAALVYLAKPSVLPKLKNFEMNLWNWPCGEIFERALVEVISARRRDRYVEAGCGEEQGEEAGSEVCLGDEYAANSSGTPRSCLRHVHISFSNSSMINIIDELKHRQVDLDGEPFNLYLDYPESREVEGRVSGGIWGDWR